MERSATFPRIHGWYRACLAVGLSAGSLISKLFTKSFAPLLMPSQHFLLKSSLPVKMEALQMSHKLMEALIVAVSSVCLMLMEDKFICCVGAKKHSRRNGKITLGDNSHVPLQRAGGHISNSAAGTGPQLFGMLGSPNLGYRWLEGV